MTASISETYRKLETTGNESFFSLMWVVYIAPIVLITLNPYFIISSLLIGLVASNPNYWERKGIQDDIHVIAAISTVVFSFFGLIDMNVIVGSILFAIYIACVVMIQVNLWLFGNIKNETYWQEVLAATIIPIALFFIL